MIDDWKPGDIAVRTIDPSGRLAVGSLSKVTSTWLWSGGYGIPPCVVLELEGRVPAPGRQGWVSYNFRKLPKASDEFTQQMRALKPSKRKQTA